MIFFNYQIFSTCIPLAPATPQLRPRRSNSSTDDSHFNYSYVRYAETKGPEFVAWWSNTKSVRIFSSFIIPKQVTLVRNFIRIKLFASVLKRFLSLPSSFIRSMNRRGARKQQRKQHECYHAKSKDSLYSPQPSLAFVRSIFLIKCFAIADKRNETHRKRNFATLVDPK